ncbi:MAG: prolipoprotein diacylglyceryl transferase, partial [Alphaproteobacteria bacterium]
MTPPRETEPMTEAIILPEFNPFAIQIGAFGIRWYALAYIVGLLLGYYLLRREARQPHAPIQPFQLDILLNYVLFGVILGGRLGYVAFYNPAFFLSHPFEILKIWQGGMSFHGGFAGVILAVIWTARSDKINLQQLSDRVAMVAPIGLGLGRVANFINGELYGRVTSHPVGMIFPGGGPLPRHPSQLYEAALEGLVLGLLLWLAVRRGWLDRPWALTGLFALGYGLSRFAVEMVREPDAHIGFVAGL